MAVRPSLDRGAGRGQLQGASDSARQPSSRWAAGWPRGPDGAAAPPPSRPPSPLLRGWHAAAPGHALSRARPSDHRKCRPPTLLPSAGAVSSCRRVEGPVVTASWAPGQTNGGNSRAVFSVCASVSPELHPRAGGGCPDVMGWGETMALASLPGRASTLTAHLSDKGPANGVRSLLTPTLVLQRRPGRSHVTCHRCCSGQPVRCRRHPHSPCKEELNLMSLSEHQSHGRLGVREQTLRVRPAPRPSTPSSVLAGLGVALGGQEGFGST